MVLGAGDENDDVAGQIDPVYEDDVVDLPGDRGKRPDAPELRTLASERAPAAGHISLALIGQEPFEEGPELLCGAIEPMRSGRPARLAKPSLRSRSSLAVPYHPAPAHRAFDIVHACNSSTDNFQRVFTASEQGGYPIPSTRFVHPHNWMRTTLKALSCTLTWGNR